MTKKSVSQMTDTELVELFADCCVQQDIGLLGKGTTWFNRFFDRMHEADGELKRRDRDQRRKLLMLFAHHNMQVRIQVAKVTLAVAPIEARRQLEDIVASKWFPQAGDAGCVYVAWTTEPSSRRSNSSARQFRL